MPYLYIVKIDVLNPSPPVYLYSRISLFQFPWNFDVVPNTNCPTQVTLLTRRRQKERSACLTSDRTGCEPLHRWVWPPRRHIQQRGQHHRPAQGLKWMWIIRSLISARPCRRDPRLWPRAHPRPHAMPREVTPRPHPPFLAEPLLPCRAQSPSAPHHPTLGPAASLGTQPRTLQGYQCSNICAHIVHMRAEIPRHWRTIFLVISLTYSGCVHIVPARLAWPK